MFVTRHQKRFNRSRSATFHKFTFPVQMGQPPTCRLVANPACHINLHTRSWDITGGVLLDVSWFFDN